MSRFCTLASSSRGNCAYLSGGGASLLIDAGVSLRAVTRALQRIGAQLDELCGIVVTHEHTDHIRGLPALLGRLRVPLLASAGTLAALAQAGLIPPGAILRELGGDEELGGIAVRAFETPHDAAGPVGLRFQLPDGRAVGACTDLGHVNDRVRDALAGCDLVLLESNYDPAMLRGGPYPWPVKRRVAGERGHLSNDEGAALAAHLAATGATHFVLGHLSQNNNRPELAYSAARAALEARGAAEGRDFLLAVAPAGEAMDLIVF